MTIKQQYQKAYRNYLRRVNRQVRQGYVVDPIPRVKKPTRASISRLEKQTAQIIKSNSPIQDFLTGEILDTPAVRRRIKTKEFSDTTTETVRRRIERENRAFTQLTPQQQEIAYELQTVDVSQIQEQLTPVLSPVNPVDVIISNWYSRIDSLQNPDLREYMREKTDAILEGADTETRAEFAWAYDQNPNIIGDYMYLNKNAIDSDFNNLRALMKWAPDSEDFQEFFEIYQSYDEE